MLLRALGWNVEQIEELCTLAIEEAIGVAGPIIYRGLLIIYGKRPDANVAKEYGFILHSMNHS